MSTYLKTTVVAFLTLCLASIDVALAAPLAVTVPPVRLVAASTVPAPLPQQAGSTAGPNVDKSLKHGAYNGVAPMLYPANPHAAAAGKLLSTKDVLLKTRLDGVNIVAQGLTLEGINLRYWSDVQKEPRMREFTRASIASQRLVYEITTVFKSTYSYHGNTWSSGKHIFVIDAESGAPLYGAVQGTLTHSNHFDDIRQLQH